MVIQCNTVLIRSMLGSTIIGRREGEEKGSESMTICEALKAFLGGSTLVQS